jgi:hypothetical protein
MRRQQKKLGSFNNLRSTAQEKAREGEDAITAHTCTHLPQIPLQGNF